MKEFFKSKISPIFALIMVVAFGYCALYLMSQVFDQYAGDEMQINHGQTQNQQK